MNEIVINSIEELHKIALEAKEGTIVSVKIVKKGDGENDK